tara:strand:- start:427 stop:807 length:381 start_codon:yes stop_codon:yes gene_type:complete
MFGIDEPDDPTMFFQIPDPGWEDFHKYQKDEIRRNTERARNDSAWVFHQNNPAILLELRRLALQLKAAGHRKYSIKGLFEVLRFNAAIKTTGKKYKLNNNLTPFYARLLMETEPQLKGFFNTRKSA